ncbi:hypothetical protein E2C01_098728 [Portunus trituberculatus]|uniref:Uncharacterized protein n=1 Tax=Portunus trituberculatus TaxID=210409 RepID=A0A5B7KCU5_PORTR|nr:hypothetical protein [Portunus trituberculatus]
MGPLGEGVLEGRRGQGPS